jgi:hypothetical protein
LGIDRSYVFINAFLYSVYGQAGGTRHIGNEAITKYRNRWINTIVRDQPIEAIIALGQLADTAYQQWKATPRGSASTAAYASIRHPTYPESASRSGGITKAAAFEKLCDSWNQLLNDLHPVVTSDSPVPLRLYGATITKDDLSPIPPRDLPAGAPAWMCALDAWAVRQGETPQLKRATFKVTVPRVARTWPPVT